MSKPRHHPRTASQVKLRLRLPTDGSVDLDKLRAALEARLEKPPAPEPEVKVVPVPARPKVAPLTKPQPEPRPKSSGVWQWINNNAPTAVSIFSAVLAFFFGLIYIGQKSTGGSVWPLLGWVFFASIGVFAISFAVVVFRQLKLEGSAASKHWAEIKEDPKKAYVPALIFAGVTVVVLLGLAIFQSPSSEIAQGKDKTKTGTTVSPQGKQPGDSKGSPLPPEVPSPKPPATKTPESDKKIVTESFRPEKGFGGRLLGVLGMGVVIGCGLFQLKRLRRKMHPDIESFQAASKTEYFGFTRGFRTFIASQGAYVLVSAAASIPLILMWYVKFPNATVTGFLLSVFLGVGVSLLMVLSTGAAGLDLMPHLDRTIPTWAGGSSMVRYLKRKTWQMLLGGIVLGSLSYAWILTPISEWVGSLLELSLTWGQLVAAFWWHNMMQKDKKRWRDHNLKLVPVLPLKNPLQMLRTKWVPTPAFILFNLPFLIVSGCLLALLPVVFGTSAKWLWFYFPLGVAVAIALSALVKRHPRLLRRWRELCSYPALVAFTLDMLVWNDSFFIVFPLVMGMIVVGVSFSDSSKTEEAVKGMLILPEKRGDYRPVINPDRNGVQIRWGSLAGVVTVVILLLISSGFFVWNGL